MVCDEMFFVQHCAITDFFITPALKLSKNHKLSSGERLALAGGGARSAANAKPRLHK